MQFFVRNVDRKVGGGAVGGRWGRGKCLCLCVCMCVCVCRRVGVGARWEG